MRVNRYPDFESGFMTQKNRIYCQLWSVINLVEFNLRSCQQLFQLNT